MIGIFDSGVGGLTVFKEIRKAFPLLDIIYFGDTARVPYGSKSPETVIEYSLQNTRFLLNFDVNVIIVACNTASAVALEEIEKLTLSAPPIVVPNSVPLVGEEEGATQNSLLIKVIGVINPGAIAAVNNTKNGKIGVIGTEGTIKSKAYGKAIKSLNKDIVVFEKACPLFVPLVEEGWVKKLQVTSYKLQEKPTSQQYNITKKIAEIYLKDLLKNDIDTLVLGCTHYPILKPILQEVCGDRIQLIDSASAVANQLRLTQEQSSGTGQNSFFVSDSKERFQHIATNILDIKDFTLTRVQI